MFIILMKHEAISSQAGEVTQLPQFPWRILPSMFSELVHYRHLVLSARVITFVTITQLRFMLHVFMHSKSIFLGTCVMTWVTFQHHSLQLFVIYIEVRSQSTLFSNYILVSGTFLLFLVLYQSLLYGSCVFFLEHLYSHSSHWNFWSFSFSDRILLLLSACIFKFFYLVSLYSQGVHSCRSSVSIPTFIWSYNKVPTGNKAPKILTDILGMGLWQNY